MSPDGDAVGSLLGMGWMLRVMGKDPVLVCQDPLPRRFSYLPGFNSVLSGTYEGPFDLLIVLDCSDPARIGTALPQEQLPSPVLNIDHHVTNLQFGTLNVVDTQATSTTHVLYRLMGGLDVRLDEQIATCLLTGLVTDTRGFRTSNVTPEVLQVALDFMRAGAPLPLITQNALDRRTLASLRLWGLGLGRVEVTDGIAWTTLPLELQRSLGINGRGVTGLSNILISAEEVQVSAVFTERSDGTVDVGFRAVPGFNVANVALSLGGGGHALAAGCLVAGPMEEALQLVLSALREDVERQREENVAHG
jgi:phosphoesterase RecJ-like protein